MRIADNYNYSCIHAEFIYLFVFCLFFSHPVVLAFLIGHVESDLAVFRLPFSLQISL